MSSSLKMACVVGTRPNFIKMAPLLEAFGEYSRHLKPVLIHTGQHYDGNLSDVFFEQLGLPNPDFHLGVPPGNPLQQVSSIVRHFDEICEREDFSRVLVVGDVNSTAACALVAAHRQIPIDHVEAGLRSFDRSMPEEINRVVTDSVADLLFVTESSAVRNLLNEGKPEASIKLVGNVMVDSLLQHLNQFQAVEYWRHFDLKHKAYGVVTLHRPSNVDCLPHLGKIVTELASISGTLLPLVFPVHPRTRRNLSLLETSKNLIVHEPMGYIEFLSLLDGAAVVITDSGGIQEETTVLQVPCLTLRNNTERPVTIEQGTNTLIGTDPSQIRPHVSMVLEGTYKRGSTPPFWDGQASKRIAQTLVNLT